MTTLNPAAVMEDISHLTPNQQNVLAAFCKAQAAVALHKAEVIRRMREFSEAEEALREAQKFQENADKELKDASKRMESVFGFGSTDD